MQVLDAQNMLAMLERVWFKSQDAILMVLIYLLVAILVYPYCASSWCLKYACNVRSRLFQTPKHYCVTNVLTYLLASILVFVKLVLYCKLCKCLMPKTYMQCSNEIGSYHKNWRRYDVTVSTYLLAAILRFVRLVSYCNSSTFLIPKTIMQC